MKCQQPSSVVILDVEGFGLTGSLSADLSGLQELAVLVSSFVMLTLEEHVAAVANGIGAQLCG